MAKLFSGMSKDNILDGLVEKTGKNGRELYDYLMALLGDKPPKSTISIEQFVDSLNNKTAEECRKGIKRTPPNAFKGTKQELLDFARMYMGEGDYELLAKWKTSTTNGYFAQCITAAMGLQQFIWYHTALGKDAKNKTKEIVVEYHVIWDENTNGLGWYEKCDYDVRQM